AGGGALSLLVIGLLTAPAWVRGKAQREAQARGFNAEVGSVGLGIGRVWLRSVRLTSPGDDFELRLDAVSVGIFSRDVRAVGGSLRGKGDPSTVLNKLRGKAAGESGAAERAPS